jgi:predicted molibdopterin-dependent oxidoreductase YjgC
VEEPAPAEEVSFTVDGRVLRARRGETVAAALLAAGIGMFRRSAWSGAPRAPYCMMGICFECSMTIDGHGNQQACLTAIRDGMRIDLERGTP